MIAWPSFRQDGVGSYRPMLPTATMAPLGIWQLYSPFAVVAV